MEDAAHLDGGPAQRRGAATALKVLISTSTISVGTACAALGPEGAGRDVVAACTRLKQAAVTSTSVDLKDAFDADLCQYDQRLLSEWALLGDQVCDELGEGAGEAEMANAGRAILKWAEDASVPDQARRQRTVGLQRFLPHARGRPARGLAPGFRISFAGRLRCAHGRGSAMTEWQARTIEQRNLLNPAFCAVVLWNVAKG